MDIKDLNIFRFRFFNIRLFGNCRLGLFKEISAKEITGFIRDFRDFCNSKKETISAESDSSAPLTDNSNFMILERLCEQYYVYEDTDKFQKKII